MAEFEVLGSRFNVPRGVHESCSQAERTFTKAKLAKLKDGVA